MAAICGSTVIVSMKDNAGTPAYGVVAGLRTRALQFNAEAVDVTNANSTNGWKELLGGCGVKSWSISGNGIAQNDASQDELLEAFLAGSIRDWKFDFPGFGALEAGGKITALQFGADYNDSMTFDITVEGAEEPTWTAS